MTIRRALVALAATAALVLVGAGPAIASGSPHFIKNGTSVTDLTSGATLAIRGTFSA